MTNICVGETITIRDNGKRFVGVLEKNSSGEYVIKSTKTNNSSDGFHSHWDDGVSYEEEDDGVSYEEEDEEPDSAGGRFLH